VILFVKFEYEDYFNNDFVIHDKPMFCEYNRLINKNVDARYGAEYAHYLSWCILDRARWGNDMSKLRLETKLILARYSRISFILRTLYHDYEVIDALKLNPDYDKIRKLFDK